MSEKRKNTEDNNASKKSTELSFFSRLLLLASRIGFGDGKEVILHYNQDLYGEMGLRAFSNQVGLPSENNDPPTGEIPQLLVQQERKGAITNDSRETNPDEDRVITSDEINPLTTIEKRGRFLHIKGEGSRLTQSAGKIEMRRDIFGEADPKQLAETTIRELRRCYSQAVDAKGIADNEGSVKLPDNIMLHLISGVAGILESESPGIKERIEPFIKLLFFASKKLELHHETRKKGDKIQGSVEEVRPDRSEVLITDSVGRKKQLLKMIVVAKEGINYLTHVYSKPIIVRPEPTDVERERYDSEMEVDVFMKIMELYQDGYDIKGMFQFSLKTAE